MRPAFTVVTPMYNEADRIEANLAKLLATLDGSEVPWSLVVVDDGSTDDSAERARRALEGRENALVSRYSPNRGRGHALRHGFTHATGDIIVTTESDLSWGPEIVPQLVAPIAAGKADMVIASPYMTGGRLENVPWQRALLSRAGNLLLGRAYGTTMATGMTRAYRREVLDRITLTADDKEFHLEALSGALEAGFRVREIPAVLRWDEPDPNAPPRRSSLRLHHVWTHLKWLANPYPTRAR